MLVKSIQNNVYNLDVQTSKTKTIDIELIHLNRSNLKNFFLKEAPVEKIKKHNMLKKEQHGSLYF